MLPEQFASIVNLAGFVAGLALYAMLLAMVVRNPQAALAYPDRERRGAAVPRAFLRGHEPLLVAAACLGLCWNLGALYQYGLVGLGVAAPPPILPACALTALGFLPAVVVHAALRPALAGPRRMTAMMVVWAGYLLAAGAGPLHLWAAITHAEPHSDLALRVLTVGFLAIVLVLVLRERRHVTARRTLSLVALAVFAVSALHIAQHEALRDSWMVEVTGHHASLPLALAILYQDYPFALADIFLKRALALVVVMSIVLAGCVGIAAWTLPGAREPLAMALLIGLSTAIALLYPQLRRGVHWFVDSIVLRRPDYEHLRTSIEQAVADAEAPDTVVSGALQRLAPAVGAKRAACWQVGENGSLVPVGPSPVVGTDDDGTMPVAQLLAELEAAGHREVVHADARKTAAVVAVPTAEPPRYLLTIAALAGGRRLLSDDIAMLGSVAHVLARRIDVLRLEQERCEQRCRETEVRRLATEAELRALRAQINPHFLFNALTTVGYLIQTSSEQALDKLVQLTELLRRVLRTDGEFTTLGQELDLIRLYLDIEQARFEERLQVTIDVPRALYDLRVPTFVLQPLVENAVKHGIAPSAAGGHVIVRATLEEQRGRNLSLAVSDPGGGGRGTAGRHPGIGLRNLQQRLKHHYGAEGLIWIRSGSQGTTVTVRLPADPGTSDRHGQLAGGHDNYIADARTHS
jgi:hypothetical protein